MPGTGLRLCRFSQATNGRQRQRTHVRTQPNTHKVIFHSFAHRTSTSVQWCGDGAMLYAWVYDVCVCVCLRPLQIWKWTANRLCIEAHRWRRRWQCAVCTQRRSRLAVLSTVECTTELPTNHIYYTQPLLRSALCIVKANAAQHSKECIDDADVVRWQCDSLLPSRIGHTQHV